MSNLETFDFEDFILDQSFREFVEGSKQESVDFWNNWISDHPKKLPVINKAREVILVLQSHKKTTFGTEKNEALENLLSEIRDREKPRHAVHKLYSGWIRIAAALIITIGLACVLFWIFNNTIHKDSPVSFTEIIVPIGEKSQIVLSDGTHVWINSGTRFRYPENFGKESRDVLLSGEAYFDVTRGKSNFTVTTHDAKIEVLGTAFNVKSYPEDLKTQTTVVRGKVRVESKIRGEKPVMIRPAQMAVIKNVAELGKKKESIESIAVISNVNTTAITSWKDQLLVFADETFEDITIKMERWFNMKIRIDDIELKKARYTGKFVNNETVYQVLEAIQVTTPIEYKVKHDEIIITRKK